MSGQRTYLTPYVVEQTGNVERSFDIFSRLLKDRIIFLSDINDVTAELVIAQMLYLESQDTEKPINLYINSPGGSVTSGLAIYDTIQYIKSEVQTICLGEACSMAAIILASGTRGKRMILPSSRVMIHQVRGGAYGQARDIGIRSKELIRLKNLSIEYLALHTGKSKEQVANDMERDFFMTADEAIKYGIADEILKGKKDGASS